MRFDHFTGNEVTYIFTLIGLGCIPLTFEWLQECHVRQVVIEFEPGTLIVRKPRGGILRKITFLKNAVVRCTFKFKVLFYFYFSTSPCFNCHSERYSQIHVTHSEPNASTIHGPYCLITEHNTHDLVSLLYWYYLLSFFKLISIIIRHELAQALGMRETDLFVERMFAVTAKREKEALSFAEFLKVLKKFSDGSLKEKYELMFAMCDINGTGRVRRRQFIELIKSLNSVAGVCIDESSQNHVIENLLYRSGVSMSNDFLTYADFEAVFSQTDERRPVGVDFRGAKLKINLQETASLNSFSVPNNGIRSLPKDILGSVAAFMETYRQHIAIMFIFCSVNAIIFTERFWHYRYETEHRDLRRVMGAGIAITRGAAGALSFCMALILLTVCRNVITVVRDTPLGEFIPFDSAITFHKTVGPWTWKLRSEIIRAQASGSPYPLLHLNGPYGDGNQIYFLWVCPSHKNYEWFIDVLKDVEDLDSHGILETHIFVTQFFHKFDLRTTMLFICEKHFRGDHGGISMFTGLRAQNHFGRPNFDIFLKFIQNRHSDVSDIGVFSCGPSSINKQLSAACAQANRARDAPSFMHRFETF
uniref:EF-hand domain-containing protein n=1 Tax=Heterorhabditis bacteriophora TaxID=37862 RepID=A0A1I7XRB6_HETBA